MRVMGFNLKKQSIEKLGGKNENIKVNNQIDFSNIREVDSNILKTKEMILEIGFKYHVSYDPDFAKVEIEGEVLLAVDPKVAKETLKQWKKKQLPDEFRIPLFNFIMSKASLKALSLEDDLNIPFHIPMPSFRKDQ